MDFIQSSGYSLVKFCKASAFLWSENVRVGLIQLPDYILLLFRGCELRHFLALIVISV